MDKTRKYICTDGRTAIVQQVGFRDFYGEVYNTDGEFIEWTRTQSWDGFVYWLNNSYYLDHGIGIGWTRDKYAHPANIC